MDGQAGPIDNLSPILVDQFNHLTMNEKGGLFTSA
jgi:hypothetical protein